MFILKCRFFKYVGFNQMNAPCSILLLSSFLTVQQSSGACSILIILTFTLPCFVCAKKDPPCFKNWVLKSVRQHQQTLISLIFSFLSSFLLLCSMQAFFSFWIHTATRKNVLLRRSSLEVGPFWAAITAHHTGSLQM